ncbi:MAG: diadenylate cyclase CdaA [Candidatus Cloacimonetes bacterium]|nr:diadenylate cyclase CdaA [Candidatus Cloacimonadota bacterium]
MNFLIPKITDIIDVLLVAFLLYRLVLLLRKTGGIQILLGLGAVLILYFTVSMLDLNLMKALLQGLRDYWPLAFIIIFQQEIRGMFARMAHNHDFQSIFKDSKKSVYANLLNAVAIMSFRKVGALIVFENSRKLDEYIESGEIIDAHITVKLLLTIFNSKTILHDGAVIIRNNRIYACKVVLPLSERVEFKQKLGTRHLAALGVSEETDAFAVIVSEETGKISIAQSGEIVTGISQDELSQRIKDGTS